MSPDSFDAGAYLRERNATRAAARRAAAPEMRAVCLAAIREFYSTWRAQSYPRYAREPRVTVASLRGYLEQANSAAGVPVPQAFREEGYHFQVSMVRSALEALVRTGDLETSLGPGAHGEVRMYSPKGD